MYCTHVKHLKNWYLCIKSKQIYLVPSSRCSDLKGDGSISTAVWQNSKAAGQRKLRSYLLGTAHCQVTLLASKHIGAVTVQNGLSIAFFFGTAGSYNST